MKNFLILASIASLISGISFGADAKKGAEKYKTLCAACHGAAGLSANDLWPNLAGQKEKYLVKQIKAFKSGERKDPSMLPMVSPLTDADIDNIAAHIAALKGSK